MTETNQTETDNIRRNELKLTKKKGTKLTEMGKKDKKIVVKPTNQLN